jgi:hypothetical protein
MVVEAPADPVESERLARAQLLEALRRTENGGDLAAEDLAQHRVMHGPTPAVTDGGPTIRDPFAPKTNPTRLGMLEARRGGTKPDPGLRGTVARPPTGKPSPAQPSAVNSVDPAGSEQHHGSSEPTRSIRAIARQDVSRMPASFWPELTAAAPGDVAPVQEYFFRTGRGSTTPDHDPAVRPRSAGRHAIPSGAQRWANAARPAAARGRAPLASTGSTPSKVAAPPSQQQRHRNFASTASAAASAGPMMVNGMGSSLLTVAANAKANARPHTAGAARVGSAAVGLRQGRPRTATNPKRRVSSAHSGKADLVASGVAVEPTPVQVERFAAAADEGRRGSAAESVDFGDVICATTPDAVAE